MSDLDDEPDDRDDGLDGFDDFAASLRAQLTPVVTPPDRAAATRERAHALLRRGSAPPVRREHGRLFFLVEASTALAAGAVYVAWTIKELWPR